MKDASPVRVWLTLTVALFVIVELVQWLRGWSLPEPLYWLGGLILATAANWNHRAAWPFKGLAQADRTSWGDRHLPLGTPVSFDPAAFNPAAFDPVALEAREMSSRLAGMKTLDQPAQGRKGLGDSPEACPEADLNEAVDRLQPALDPQAIAQLQTQLQQTQLQQTQLQQTQLQQTQLQQRLENRDSAA